MSTLRPGILLRLEISTWTGTAQLNPHDLGLSPAEISACYMLGRKRLVPRDALRPIMFAADRARAALDSLSHRMPDGGRFVLRAVVPELLAMLDQQRAAFQRAVDEFIADYPSIRQAMRPAWEEAAARAWQIAQARTGADAGRREDFIAAFLEQVDRAYPHPDTLRRKFDFFWYTYTITVGDYAPADALAVAREEAERRERDAAYRAEVDARLREAIHTGVQALHAAVADAFQRIVEHIRADRPLSESALARVRRILSRFHQLNVYDDTELERALRQFEADGLAALSPDDLNRRPDLRALFQQGAEQIAAAATAPLDEGTVSELTGRLRRSFA
jgi:hypothetical protein